MTNFSFYKQTTLPDFSREKGPPPPLPQFIGPYKIESLLNQGAMSLLYLGLDPHTKQPLAIKVLSPQFVTHPSSVERFLKETKIIALANHPNIVKLYGHGKWEGGLYIGMEFIRGISLRQFIIQHSLSLKRSLDIVISVAYALAHLHSHGVIHRDLKPENILITEEGEVKVIDFGIAQLHEEKESKKEKEGFIGTPDYMAPEQKENPMNATFASDLYSLGIITYELVLGKLSYGLINLSLLPPGLRKIVSKTLALSIKERYQDAVDFITDVSQYLSSGEWEKDRPGSDQLKELQELLQRGEQMLSPSHAPDWSILDFGIAKFKGSFHPGLYYDFFRLPNNLYLILIATSLQSTQESAIYVASLRGMIRMLFREIIQSSKSNFSSPSFITTLNQELCEERSLKHFGLQFVVLDPLRDQLSFTSAGLSYLLHLPQASSTPRRLGLAQPPLGVDPLALFSPTTDNWYAGDTLFLLSLPATAFSDINGGKEMENKWIEAVTENAFVSPNTQAEAILRKLSAYPHFAALGCPKMLMSIQRIS